MNESDIDLDTIRADLEGDSNSRRRLLAAVDQLLTEVTTLRLREIVLRRSLELLRDGSELAANKVQDAVSGTWVHSVSSKALE